MAGTSDSLGLRGVVYPDRPNLPGGASSPNYNPLANGFDLIFRQTELQNQTAAIEEDIRNIEQNTNLSDTEKMFSMQMAMNSWSAITNLRTNILKDISDALKTIARNVT